MATVVSLVWFLMGLLVNMFALTVIIITVSVTVIVAVIVIVLPIYFNNKRRLMKLIDKHQPFGDCNVFINYTDKLIITDGVCQGYTDFDHRSIHIALFSTLSFKDLANTYFHERRHTEQIFGSDEELKNKCIASMKERQSLIIFGEYNHEHYWNSFHEEDARKIAKELVAKYL